MAYSVNPKTVLRSGYGISYTFFNRVGSALEGINAPQALFGVLNQSITNGVVPASFLTTQNSFTTGIANPSSFNPVNSNVVYIPPNTKWPYVQNWFLSVQRELEQEHDDGSGLQRESQPAPADSGRLQSGVAKCADRDLQSSWHPPSPPVVWECRRGGQFRRYGPITWVDPAGDNDYNGLSARLEHRFGGGLYFLNSFTWGKALGDSEQALEYFAGYFEANPQNIHNLAAERGPSSFDVEFNNVTSIVYQMPFGKGRKYGAHMNAALNAVAGGWEFNTINTAHTGTPLDVVYAPSTINDNTGLSNDYRGEAFLRPNVTGSALSQSTSQMLNTYFAGYTFTTPPATAPYGERGPEFLPRARFRAMGFCG